MPQPTNCPLHCGHFFSALAVCCAGLLTGCTTSPAPDLDAPPPTPDPRFGTVEAYHAPELADRANVGWERIIFYWSEIERDGPDDWNWFHAPVERLDQEIAAGREIVGLVSHTPSWATDGIEGAGVPSGLYLPIDDPLNVWANFIRYLVTVYGDRVHHWIIWNEPDIPLDTFGAQWQGTTGDYYQLVKVAYLSAREVDPDAQIHLGGLTYWHNPTYLRELLTIAHRDPTAAEHGYYFDVVSVHIYFKPETTLSIMASIQQTLDDFGLDKPIWLNETNAPPYDDPLQPWGEPVFQVTQEMQASFVLQEAALALSMGVERIGVYKWVDEPPPPPGFEPYGMIRADGSTRPAYDAYRTMTTYYAGVHEADRFEQPEMWTVALARGEATTRVAWTRGPYRVVALMPALAGSALLLDQTGTGRLIRPIGGMYLLNLDPAPCAPDEECIMGGPPLLIVEDAPADLANRAALEPRLAFDLTPRTVGAGIGAGLLLLAALTSAILLFRQRRR